MADLMRALAHPTRISVIESLLECPKCVNDIRELLDVSQPNLSQHLTLLRKEKLVDFTENGKKRCYRLCRPELLRSLMDLLQAEPGSGPKGKTFGGSRGSRRPRGSR